MIDSVCVCVRERERVRWTCDETVSNVIERGDPVPLTPLHFCTYQVQTFSCHYQVLYLYLVQGTASATMARGIGTWYKYQLQGLEAPVRYKYLYTKTQKAASAQQHHVVTTHHQSRVVNSPKKTVIETVHTERRETTVRRLSCCLIT